MQLEATRRAPIIAAPLVAGRKLFPCINGSQRFH
jgi:hypothetical protein